MLKTLFINLFIVMALGVLAQSAGRVQMFTGGMGYSRNVFYGKGDFGGFFCSSAFSSSIKGRWGITATAAASVHEGNMNVYYRDQNSVWQEGELRHMTGGLQSSAEFGYSLVSSKYHLLQIGMGPVFRYQITTFPYGQIDFSSSYFRVGRYIKSFGVGGSGFVSYSYIFQNQWVVQVRASLQYISSNDNQNMFGLLVGKILSKPN